MMRMSRLSDSHIAIADFPDAVGPQMTGMLASADGGRGAEAEGGASASSEAALELIPRKLHDSGSAMHVVRGQPALAQGDKKRPHLLRRQRIARPAGRLAF